MQEAGLMVRIADIQRRDGAPKAIELVHIPIEQCRQAFPLGSVLIKSGPYLSP